LAYKRWLAVVGCVLLVNSEKAGRRILMTDQLLKRAVESELNWEPSIKSPAAIGVAVKDGIVTLTGRVESYSENIAAERAATRVFGVKAVANDLEVRLPIASERTDEDIARAAINVLEWTSVVPPDKVKVTVRDGWITLEGTVNWQYQKTAVEEAVRYPYGVKGVTNFIEVEPQVTTAIVQKAIEEALKRDAEVDAKNIKVETSGGKVILRGTVRSWFERQEAERVAWEAPGVSKVENQISIAA